MELEGKRVYMHVRVVDDETDTTRTDSKRYIKKLNLKPVMSLKDADVVVWYRGQDAVLQSACGLGIPVVKPSWLKACKTAGGRAVDMEPFLEFSATVGPQVDFLKPRDANAIAANLLKGGKQSSSGDLHSAPPPSAAANKPSTSQKKISSVASPPSANSVVTKKKEKKMVNHQQEETLESKPKNDLYWRDGNNSSEHLEQKQHKVISPKMLLDDEDGEEQLLFDPNNSSTTSIHAGSGTASIHKENNGSSGSSSSVGLRENAASKSKTVGEQVISKKAAAAPEPAAKPNAAVKKPAMPAAPPPPQGKQNRPYLLDSSSDEDDQHPADTKAEDSVAAPAKTGNANVAVKEEKVDDEEVEDEEEEDVEFPAYGGYVEGSTNNVHGRGNADRDDLEAQLPTAQASAQSPQSGGILAQGKRGSNSTATGSSGNNNPVQELQRSQMLSSNSAVAAFNALISPSQLNHICSEKKVSEVGLPKNQRKNQRDSGHGKKNSSSSPSGASVRQSASPQKNRDEALKPGAKPTAITNEKDSLLMTAGTSASGGSASALDLLKASGSTATFQNTFQPAHQNATGGSAFDGPLSACATLENTQQLNKSIDALLFGGGREQPAKPKVPETPQHGAPPVFTTNTTTENKSVAAMETSAVSSARKRESLGGGLTGRLSLMKPLPIPPAVTGSSSTAPPGFYDHSSNTAKNRVQLSLDADIAGALGVGATTKSSENPSKKANKKKSAAPKVNKPSIVESDGSSDSEQVEAVVAAMKATSFKAGVDFDTSATKKLKQKLHEDDSSRVGADEFQDLDILDRIEKKKNREKKKKELENKKKLAAAERAKKRRKRRTSSSSEDDDDATDTSYVSSSSGNSRFDEEDDTDTSGSDDGSSTAASAVSSEEEVQLPLPQHAAKENPVEGKNAGSKTKLQHVEKGTTAAAVVEGKRQKKQQKSNSEGTKAATSKKKAPVATEAPSPQQKKAKKVEAMPAATAQESTAVPPLAASPPRPPISAQNFHWCDPQPTKVAITGYTADPQMQEEREILQQVIAFGYQGVQIVENVFVRGAETPDFVICPILGQQQRLEPARSGENDGIEEENGQKKKGGRRTRGAQDTNKTSPNVQQQNENGSAGAANPASTAPPPAVTTKILYAFARGIPVVTPKWVFDSLDSSTAKGFAVNQFLAPVQPPQNNDDASSAALSYHHPIYKQHLKLLETQGPLLDEKRKRFREVFGDNNTHNQQDATRELEKEKEFKVTKVERRLKDMKGFGNEFDVPFPFILRGISVFLRGVSQSPPNREYSVLLSMLGATIVRNQEGLVAAMSAESPSWLRQQQDAENGGSESDATSPAHGQQQTGGVRSAPAYDRVIVEMDGGISRSHQQLHREGKLTEEVLAFDYPCPTVTPQWIIDSVTHLDARPLKKYLTAGYKHAKKTIAFIAVAASTTLPGGAVKDDVTPKGRASLASTAKPPSGGSTVANSSGKKHPQEDLSAASSRLSRGTAASGRSSGLVDIYAKTKKGAASAMKFAVNQMNTQQLQGEEEEVKKNKDKPAAIACIVDDEDNLVENLEGEEAIAETKRRNPGSSKGQSSTRQKKKDSTSGKKRKPVPEDQSKDEEVGDDNTATGNILGGNSSVVILGGINTPSSARRRGIGGPTTAASATPGSQQGNNTPAPCAPELMLLDEILSKKKKRKE